MTATLNKKPASAPITERKSDQNKIDTRSTSNCVREEWIERHGERGEGGDHDVSLLSLHPCNAESHLHPRHKQAFIILINRNHGNYNSSINNISNSTSNSNKTSSSKKQTDVMIGTSVDDYASVEELRRRLEHGQLYKNVEEQQRQQQDERCPHSSSTRSDDDNPQEVDSLRHRNPCAAAATATATTTTMFPLVNIDYLDWYIPEADPTQCRYQTVEEETKRLLALQSYQLVRKLDKQEREYDLDRLATIARRVFGAKMSFISIIDLGRCLFLALDGIDVREVPRRQTFCSHALIASDDFYEVRDAQRDPLFAHYPMVRAGSVRYYAAYPLICPDTGYRLGCFTVVDDEPRPDGLSERQQHTLQLLAEVAIQDLRKHRQVSRARQQLHDMAQRIATLSHDLVTPLSGVQMSLSLLQESMMTTSSSSSTTTIHNCDHPNDWTMEQQESLETLQRCTAAMERTCNQLRDTLHGGNHTLAKEEEEKEEEEKAEGEDLPNNNNNKREAESSIRNNEKDSASSCPPCKRQKTVTDKVNPPAPLLEQQHSDAEVLVRSKTSCILLATPEAEAPRKQQQQQRTALIVEDAVLVRKIMARALERLGWQVVQAEDGQSGLHMLKQRLYDVCFMDFLMPVMDGFDCCRLFREWERSQGRPQQQQRRQYIVGMSAHASNKDAEQGFRLGMDTFVSKPLGFDKLKALLKDLPPLTCASDCCCGGNDPTFTPNATAHRLPPPPSPLELQQHGSGHSCLLIGSADFVSTVEHHVKERTGWTVRAATSPELGGSTLRSRHWSLVLVDNACFGSSSSSQNDMSGTQFVQDFREWEQENRIHLQRHVYLCGASLPTVLPCGGDATKDRRQKIPVTGLPMGIDGTLHTPIQNHDLETVLHASGETRLGEELLTRY